MDVRADPPLGGTVSRIRALEPSLAPSERRVPQLCIELPDEVVELSVSDLAARTGTSPATVIRACQSLGFTGFQQLRFLLLRDLGSAARATLPDPGPGSRGRLVRIFDAARAQLGEALGALDYDSFDRAVTATAQAKRLLVVGNGGSGPFAQLVAIHLAASGRPCEAPVDVVTQQITARTLRPGDVCLVVSDSGMNVVTLRAAAAARVAGAEVVAVTSYTRSKLCELATMSLVAGASYHAPGDQTGDVVRLLLLTAFRDAVVERLPDAEARSAVMDEVYHLVDSADTLDDITGARVFHAPSAGVRPGHT